MKKIVLLLAVLSSLSLKAQMVEYYDNPQRYFFNQFNTDRVGENIIISGFPPTPSNPGYSVSEHIFSRLYSAPQDSLIQVYGVAIPILSVIDSISDLVFFTNAIFEKVMHYFDTSGSAVYIAQKNDRGAQYENAYTILSKAYIKKNETVVLGNYFHFPYINSFFSPINPVIEVYFSQPVTVSDSFWICTNLPLLNYVNSDYSYAFGGIGNLLTIGVDDTTMPQCYLKLFGDYFLIPNEGPLYGVSFIDDNTHSWGGPFPIVAPAPCMSPLRVSVAGQSRGSVSLSWEAQYGGQYYEVEWGPRGFAEGTGTVAGPVYANAQNRCNYTLTGLPMDADLTVRVRAFCGTDNYSSSYSLDIHTNRYYSVSTSVNNEAWGYVVGGGDYVADTTIRLIAYPKSEHCSFANWSDGNNQNPRMVTVTRDTSFRAVFRCDSVGIEGVSMSESLLELYPNPASKMVNLRSGQALGRWQIMDMAGRMVHRGDAEGEEDVTVDLAGFASGIYTIMVHTTAGPIIKKLIVR